MKTIFAKDLRKIWLSLSENQPYLVSCLNANIMSIAVKKDVRTLLVLSHIRSIKPIKMTHLSAMAFVHQEKQY